MRLIDADAAKEALTGWETEPTDEEIEYTIDHIPTVDAVQVVRCKDCKYSEDEPAREDAMYCKKCGIEFTNPEDYCSSGRIT